MRIDTYRSSGAGGQHVNKTDSAIRITHLPTGIVVECQDERSQHKNRSRALSLLKAKLLSAEREKQQNAQAQSRKLQVGSGDRSERIRTYNFPQGRVTDHRINLTLYKLDDVMNGNLDELVRALNQEHQAEELAQQVEMITMTPPSRRDPSQSAARAALSATANRRVSMPSCCWARSWASRARR